MLAAVLPGTAFGATLTVNTTLDAVGMDTLCSLREAITAANNDSAPFGGPGECGAGAGADRVVLPPGRFELALTGPPEDANATGDLDVGGTQLVLTGAGAGASIIDANQIDRVLQVLSGKTLTIESVTLTGGRAPDGANGTGQTGTTTKTGQPGAPGESGGGIRNAGSLTILDSTISDNRAGDGGDGASAQGADGAVLATGSPGFDGIAGSGGAGGSGGGIHNAGALALTRVAVLGNTAGTGGVGGTGTGGQGGFGLSGPSGIGGNGFGGALGDGGTGGGVSSAGGSSLIIDQSLISGNAAGAAGNGGLGQGGGGGANTSSNSAGTGGVGSGGEAGQGGNGGGVYTEDALVLTRSLIDGNTAGAGAQGGTGTGGNGGGQTGTAPAGDAGNGQGGWGGDGGSGAGVWTVPASIENTTITANQISGAGQGGLGVGGKGGNASTPGSGGDGTGGRGGVGGSGAGVQTFLGNTTIRHATITGNTLGTPGAGGSAVGGLGGSSGGSSGSSSTLGPGPSGRGGALDADNSGPSTTTLASTIVAGNSAPSCNGTVTNGAYDVAFLDASCPGANVNPQLGPLADNGGPTRTQAVGPGSPAFDAVPATGAGCPATDQRGVTRPRGQGCEIGAFEHAGPDATTGDATAITTTGTTLRGTVNPNGRATTHHFEFGTTTAYGKSTPSQNTGSGVGAVDVSAAVAGLTPNTTYHYRLVATSADGTALGADRTFTTIDGTRPRILGASLTRKVFAVLRRGRAGGAAKKGTTIKYRLSEAAQVTFTIQRATRGRRVRGKCRKQTRANRGKRACKRFVGAGRLAPATAVAGANRRKFSGRIGRRALRTARYRVTLVAIDPSGNRSAPKRLAFRIVRR